MHEREDSRGGNDEVLLIFVDDLTLDLHEMRIMAAHAKVVDEVGMPYVVLDCMLKVIVVDHVSMDLNFKELFVIEIMQVQGRVQVRVLKVLVSKHLVQVNFLLEIVVVEEAATN